MIRFKAILLLISIGFVVGPAPKLWAYWVEDGTPVSSAPGVQERQVVISDGSGGAILTWIDRSSGNGLIHVQRLDALGVIQWNIDGIPLDAEGGSQDDPSIIADGAGGAIVAWQEFQLAGTNGWDIIAQRIDGAGTIMWAPGGVPIGAGSSVQVDCQMTTDGAGGAIVTWRDHRGVDIDVFAQRIDSAGSVKWALDGVPVCEAEGDQLESQLTFDGSGGAIVTWRDSRTGDNDIYAQRLTSMGAAVWSLDGEPLCGVIGVQSAPQIASDGAGGAIVAWIDSRTGESDVYCQRVDASGAPKWATDGVPVCTATKFQDDVQITADGLGGGIISWADFRSLNWDIYSQRINTFGETVWSAQGVPLCTATGTQDYPQITSDGANGAIVTWSDSRVDHGIGVQWIDSLGSTQWVADGVTLCAAAGLQKQPQITADGAGGAIVAWTDERTSSISDDIYAQQIDGQGRVGRIAPAIHSVRDVPGDEGGSVNLAWDASPIDYRTGEITEYTVWRALATPAALALVASGQGVVADPVTAAGRVSKDSGEVILRSSPLNGEIFYWQLISSLAAYRLQGYSEVVPTLFDSTAVSSEFHYFQVISHTSDPGVFWISAPDSGYSVDNLAPAAVLNLAGHQVYGPEGLHVTWAPNTETDLSGYRIYRGSFPEFETDSAHLLATVVDTIMIDLDWEQALGYHYKAAAVDIHGNSGPPALLSPEGVSSTWDRVPGVTNALSQNHPNPFNPSTMLSFEINTPGHAVLKVYDAAGRLVVTLVDENRGAGRHEMIWDGRDHYGRMSAAGVYLYRLEVGDFVETKRMTLVK